MSGPVDNSRPKVTEEVEDVIQERVRAVEALLAERALLRALMDHVPDNIYFKDRASRFTRINKALGEYFGLRSPAEAIGKTDFDFFAPEHAREAYEDEQEVMRTGRPVVAKEEKETWADGRVQWVSTTKLPLRDPEGQIIGTFGISRDITSRKRAEQEHNALLAREQKARGELEAALASLRASEARFRRLFEANIIGVIFADVHGNLTEANDAFLRMTGYSRADLPLRWDHQLTPPEYCPLDERVRSELEATGVAPPYEKEYIAKNGRRIPVLVGAAQLEESPGNCICFVLDMTERNRMRDLLVRTEKLVSIGLLSAGIAHEINNPLAYVANNLAVLDRDFKGLMGLVDAYEAAREQLQPEAQRRIQALAEEVDLAYVRDNIDRVLTRTREGVQRVTRIVQNLRSLARADHSQMDEASVPDLIEASLEMIRGQLQRRGIAIQIDCQPTPKLRCACTQITQVLLNLLVNALQAIETAGRKQGNQIRIASRLESKEVLIEVADTGCGIDPQDLSRIFDPFFTRKPVGEGTGLGLSISHEIITGHGGHIDVASRAGEGTCFRVFLPLHPRRGAS
jgi:PAS domain S-box-containing protein